MVNIRNLILRNSGLISLFVAIFVLITYCILKVNETGINSDDISPFSFSRDILVGVPVWNWNFPAPNFIFPDVVLSIPLVYFLKSISGWLYASVVFQWLMMVSIVYLYAKSQVSRKVKIINQSINQSINQFFRVDLSKYLG